MFSVCKNTIIYVTHKEIYIYILTRESLKEILWIKFTH